RLSLSLGVLALLRILASSGRVLVAIDDVQWLDRATATALGYVLRRIGNERVGVLLAERTEPGEGERGDLIRAIDRSRVVRLELSPLTLGAVYQLVRVRLGISLPRYALVRVHRVSNGNPLFALEIVRELV